MGARLVTSDRCLGQYSVARRKIKRNMMNEKKMYRRIRNICGALGMCLPWLALIGGALVKDKPESWWYSISATYYLTPALVAVLTAASIVLMTDMTFRTT